MRGRKQVQNREINYRIDHVLVAKMEVMCVMNQSWEQLWRIAIVRETEFSGLGLSFCRLRVRNM